MLFTSRKSLVALDIGSYSIKAIQLKKTQLGYELLNMGMVRLPPDTIVDGEIENPDAVVIAIKNLLKSENIKNRNVVIGISGQSVIIKKISVPVMDEDELAEMIRDESEQYIPFDLDDVNLDFQILKRPVVKDKKSGTGDTDEESEEDMQMDVLIVAARKDTIQAYLDVTNKAGLKVKVLDLDVFAIENAYEYSNTIEENTAVALLNIGGSMTNLNILESGVTAFTRDLQVGGNTISEDIQKNLSIGYADAEKLKLGNFTDTYKKEEVLPHVLRSLEEICDEIRKTFDMYEKTSDFKISKVLISGGTCRMKDIDRIFTEKIGIPVTYLKTFKNIHYNEKIMDSAYIREMEPVMALPIGLALRYVGDK